MSIAQSSPVAYVLDWSPDADALRVSRWKDTAHTSTTLYLSTLDTAQLSKVMQVPAGARGLLYLHCWLGETPFFHRRSIGWLMRAARFSMDSVPVVLVAVRWPSGRRSYRHSAAEALHKGAALAPLLQVLSEMFGPQQMDVFCHSMGNGLFQGAWAVLRQSEPPALGRVVMFSPDVPADVFCTDLADLHLHCQQLSLYLHQRDRALWLSQWQLGVPRLGRRGPAALPDGMRLEQVDMSRLSSLSNHTHFADEQIQRQLAGSLYGQMPR